MAAVAWFFLVWLGVWVGVHYGDVIRALFEFMRTHP